MLFAPIIHARTKNNDFPSRLLVVPKSFSNEDVSWARRYITQSTRYFELSSEFGRRLIFCNETVIVTGISIKIRDLYSLCGKNAKYDTVDGGRVNYAFIGLAIPKKEIDEPFDVPYTVFLEQYEKAMDSLWEAPYCENGINTTLSQYTYITLPKAEDICELIPSNVDEKTRCVLDTKDISIDSVCAGVTMLMLNKKALGFCSDIPTANTVIESDFSVVTSKNAQQIIDTLKREEEKAAANASKEKNPKHLFKNKSKKDNDVQNVLDSIVTGTKKAWKSIPTTIKVGGTIFVILVVTLVEGSKKE